MTLKSARNMSSPDPAIGGYGVPIFREEDLNEIEVASSLFSWRSEKVEASLRLC
jgi:hypothetical protein